MSESRKTVAVDFDGVLHEYRTPWVAAHVIADGPVDGAIEWLFDTLQEYDVVIHSTRCRTWRGRRAIRRWLCEQAGESMYRESLGMRGLEEIRLSWGKVPALVYIDDRAVRFTGKFPSVRAIRGSVPWNHATRHPSARSTQPGGAA